MEADLRALRKQVAELSTKVEKTEDLARNNFFHGTQVFTMNENYKREFETLKNSIENLKVDVQKRLQSIDDGHLVRRQELNTFVANHLTEECQSHTDQLKELIMNYLNSQMVKQKENLRRELRDDLTGHVAIRETELEGKLDDIMTVKTKRHSDKLETHILVTLQEATIIHQERQEKQIDAHMQRKLAELHVTLRNYVDSQLEMKTKETTEMFQAEFNKQILKLASTAKNYLIEKIEKELEERMEIQREELSNLLNENIETKTEMHKQKIFNETTEKMNAEFLNIKEHLKDYTDSEIGDAMEIQKNELIQQFTFKMSKDFDALSNRLHKLLSEEFQGEMNLIYGELQEHTKLWRETDQEIKALNSKFVEKVPYLLKFHETEFTWHITGISRLIEQASHEDTFESEPFAVNGTGLRMKARLKFLESGPVLLLGFMPNSANNVVFYHRRTLILMDRSGNDPPKHRKRFSEPRFAKDDAKEWMSSFVGSRLLDPTKNLKEGNPYVKDDSVIIKVLIHPLFAVFKSYSSDNGILYWKIDNFTEKKLDEKNEVTNCLTSDYFYTSENGYRLQVQIHLYTRYLTVMVNFLRGPWDEFLSNVYPHKTTVTLLDQSESTQKDHFEKSLLSDDAYVDTFNKYYLKYRLAHSAYIKNDSLMVKVAVCPILKNHLPNSFD